MLPDDLLDEHRVHGLFIEDRVLFHHLLNTERLRNLFSHACHYLLHYLWYRRRHISDEITNKLLTVHSKTWKLMAKMMVK